MQIIQKNYRQSAKKRYNDVPQSRDGG
ncbi:MAG: hypothetical protein RLZZ422_2221, partial [Pseudomonadota bacterium]